MSSAPLTTGGPPAAVPTARQLNAIVGVLSLAVFMSSLDLFIVNLAFPYIGREYAGTSLSNLSWVLNGYTIVFAAVLVPAGRWADRVGRRRLFVAGMAAFSVGHRAVGSVADTMSAFAPLLIAAWMAGIWEAGVAAVPLVSVPDSPSVSRAAIAPPDCELSAVVK